jgi:MFS family permease
LTTATICILKTLYVTTNSVIATQYSSSYMAVTAFTGIPFIIAAISSIGSTMLSQIIGKRIIFVVSGFLMLVGVLWNMHVFMTYSWFMVSRVMQAVGWGASEGLVMISVRDIFFVGLPQNFRSNSN